MDIRTGALKVSSEEFNETSKAISLIAEEVRSVQRSLATQKGIDGVNSKLNRAEDDLVNCARVLSRLGGFLDMAAATYENTEKKVIQTKSTTAIAKDVLSDWTTISTPYRPPILTGFIPRQDRIRSLLKKLQKMLRETSVMTTKTYTLKSGANISAVTSVMGQIK